MLAQCNKIVYYKLRLQKGRCVMAFTVIILVFIIFLQLAVIFMLYRSRAGAVDEKDLAELVRHFEATERRMYEGLRDLRSEQATLARAARMENQSAADRLSEQLDKRFDKIGESTEKNLEQIRIIVDEKLNSTLERRLGESFSLVSRRLEEVHRGLGEMQSLAGGIGDFHVRVEKMAHVGGIHARRNPAFTEVEVEVFKGDTLRLGFLQSLQSLFHLRQSFVFGITA